MQQKLRQIDQNLIQLLGKRIVALAEADASLLEEQFPNLIPLLDQAGVPEAVWQNVVSSTATLPPDLTVSANATRRVTLIGGHGMMGRFFTERLFAAGHQVRILGREDWEQAEEILKETDLVLVCVPIECTIKIIRRTAQYLAPTTALVDITSIKAPIVKAMLEYHRGPVMGLHPMFGPSVKTFSSQNVVVCPGRGEEAFQWFLALMEWDGAHLIRCTPEEHDQIMLVVQAIRQFSTFSLGVFLTQEKIDIPRSLEFSSPSYRQEIEMINRLFKQRAPLIADILLATPERREAIVRLANTFKRLAQLILLQEREELISELQTAQSVWHDSVNG